MAAPPILSSKIDQILRSARSLGEAVRVHGAPLPARALILAAAGDESPVLVVCATDEEASDLAADVDVLARTVLRKDIPIYWLPTWDRSPYTSIAPSLRTRFDRASALAAISGLSPQSPGLVLTSLPALCQATLPRQTFEAHTVALTVDQTIEGRDPLAARIASCGYLRVDPVEDPGTFAVRGDIIDVFPPGFERPVRIELFGDTVEKIRYFDPATQRAGSDPQKDLLGRVSLPPAREVLINSTTLAHLRGRVKSRADDTGVPRTRRDPILSSIQDGLYPDHSDAWAPFAYDRPATAWDYLSEHVSVVWNDELGCQQALDQFLAEQRQAAADLGPDQGIVLPGANELFRWSPELERQLKERTRLHLDQLELTTAEALGQKEGPSAEAAPSDQLSTQHRVFVKSNSDIGTGSKQSLGDLESKFQLWIKQGFRVLALASTQSQLERIRYLLEERGLPCRPSGPAQPGVITLNVGSLSEGFRWPAEGLAILTENEIVGSRGGKGARGQRTRGQKKSSAAKDWAGLQALSDLGVGDTVVHVDHGIGRYQGLARLDLSGAPSDFLLLEYANKDKLYLPVYRLNVIQKYAGAGAQVSLDRLGGQQFAKTKDKVRDAVKKLAVDLVRIYAERKVRPGQVFHARTTEFREFEAKFPFDETPDQLKAIEDTLSDLESGKVMDRLICGDVGYGKTEVAIRAAFCALSEGKQVAVLVPTTVLAHQHEQSFRSRLADYPFTIDSVSRFKPAKEQKETLARLAAGKVDVIIGTHRLLSRDVRFRDLGLIIVDEEHRFGVEHKEKLKALKTDTHVLTLTATPIPRTLHMSLSGLRDISLINTAPVDRLPIRTYISKFDEALIKQAIDTELSRGGQVFFVHNRVETIFDVTNRIRELVPGAQIGVGHGQMAEGELEEAMVAFYQKRTNVLVCTSIIESGLDVPSANTILVNRADMFGLAQLYQIRGRVGRGQSRAYAYLLLPSEGNITEDAKRRLEVIQRFVELGSGFSIASHDLEIRGGGDLLGPSQSGHIAAVGFDLYTELLEEAIQELQGNQAALEEREREPEIKVPFPAYLSEEFIPDVHQRLSIYRRCSSAADDAEITSMEEELRDRFGELPPEAQNLLWLIRTKQLLKKTGVDILTAGPEKSSIVPGPKSKIDPARVIALVSSKPDAYQITPDSKMVARLPATSLRDLYFSLETLFKAVTL